MQDFRKFPNFARKAPKAPEVQFLITRMSLATLMEINL